MFCFDYHYSITLLYPITREKHENKGMNIFIFPPMGRIRKVQNRFIIMIIHNLEGTLLSLI